MKIQPDWFDRNMYIPSTDPNYWKMMISSRLHLLSIEQKCSESGKMEKARRQFVHLTKTTTNQSKPDLAASDQVLRAMGTAFAKPSAFQMRFADLDHLLSWSQTSDEYQALRAEVKTLQLDSKPKRWRERKNSGIEKRSLTDIARKHLASRATVITDMAGLKDPFESPAHVPILVNLSKPLTEIMADIRQMKSQKSDHGRLLLEREKEFRTWHKFGVLPYFDLRMWSRLYGVRLRNQDIQDLIWPPASKRYINEETLKKTSSKYLKKVISQSTLDKL